MSRLTHTSFEAEHRSNQLSDKKLIFYVEGFKDVPFYEKIIKIVLGNKAVKYEIKTSDALQGFFGVGKPAILKQFKELERLGALTSDFQDKRTVYLFFLDKDIDDFLGKMIRSENVVYTKFYSMENYYFLYGNIIETICIILCSSEARVKPVFECDNTIWTRKIAEKLKMWALYCFFTQKYYPEAKSYDYKISLFHPENGLGEFSKDEFEKYILEIREKIGKEKFGALWKTEED